MSRSLLGALAMVFLAVGCARGSGAAAERERYIDDCLNKTVDGEGTSRLWKDLSKFAFALPAEDTEPERAEAVLNRAAKSLTGLDTEAGWASAGRYFQAENFHAFERPCCARAWQYRKR